jgi:phage portal protein BeeE
MARLQGNEELELAPHDHKLLRLLHRPNAFDTYETLWQKIELYGDLTGNIYLWEAAHDRLGHPVELWVLPSHWVYRAQQTQEQIERGEMVSGYEIRPYGVRARASIVLPASDVIHLPYPHPMTPLDGYSPLTAGAEWIDTLDAIDTARFSAMKQGIWPGLIMKLAPDVLDPDKDTMDRLRQRFRQHFQGEDKFGKPLVLSPGMDVTQATRPLMSQCITGSSFR